jgi:AraC-like DNA-binding protein
MFNRMEAPVQHLREWSELLSGSFTRFTFEAPNPAGFRGWMGVRTIAGIDFIKMRTEEHVARRETVGEGRDERPDYLVCLQVSGTGEFSQDGRTATLRPGDVTVFDTTRPTIVASSDDYRNLCMKFPQRALGLTRGRMSELTAVRFGADDGLTPALRGMLSTLDAVGNSLTGRGGYLAANSALDLAATLFENSLGYNASGARGHRALLDRVHDYIGRHMHDPDLSPGAVAAAHHISLRHLHAVFGNTGTTVAATIRRMRLERARRILADPSLRETPVSVIGGWCGFSTASAFGRAFCDTYHVSPGRYREMAMATVAP